MENSMVVCDPAISEGLLRSFIVALMTTAPRCVCSSAHHTHRQTREEQTKSMAQVSDTTSHSLSVFLHYQPYSSGKVCLRALSWASPCLYTPSYWLTFILTYLHTYLLSHLQPHRGAPVFLLSCVFLLRWVVFTTSFIHIAPHTIQSFLGTYTKKPNKSTWASISDCGKEKLPFNRKKPL